eukprot:3098339-Amphidinium_carterae.1
MCAQWVYSKTLRVLLEQLITTKFPLESLMCYIDYCCYDETPLKTGLKGTVLTSNSGGQSGCGLMAS